MSEELPHDQAQVESARMHQKPLEDVLMATQMRTSHRARLVQVGKGVFDVLGKTPADSAATCPAEATAIRVDEGWRLRQIAPAAAAAIRFGDVQAHVERVQVDERAVAVIALVGDQLIKPRGAPARSN